MRVENSPFEKALSGIQDVTVLYDEPMSDHTTFRIGGPADYYVVPYTVDALVHVLTTAQCYGIPFFVMGRGSNLLFDDMGFGGVVLTTTELKECFVRGSQLTASAGCSLTSVTKLAAEHALTGLEFAHGIPGSVGGAVFMNAGAYGGEIAEVLAESTYYDTVSGEVATLQGELHHFGYRHSSYRDHPEWILLSASFSLHTGEADAIRGKMEELMARRVQKQPLDYPSAGSTFKRYPGRYTGQMIDEVGLKGCSVGGAQISEKHAGFIINRGGATAADVRLLIAKVQETIKERYGIDIETEVVFVPSCIRID